MRGGAAEQAAEEGARVLCERRGRPQEPLLLSVRGGVHLALMMSRGLPRRSDEEAERMHPHLAQRSVKVIATCVGVDDRAAARPA